MTKKIINDIILMSSSDPDGGIKKCYGYVQIMC